MLNLENQNTCDTSISLTSVIYSNQTTDFLYKHDKGNTVNLDRLTFAFNRQITKRLSQCASQQRRLTRLSSSILYNSVHLHCHCLLERTGCSGSANAIYLVIWPWPGNTATPLIRPIFWDPLVTVLTGFYCTTAIRNAWRTVMIIMHPCVDTRPQSWHLQS